MYAINLPKACFWMLLLQENNKGWEMLSIKKNNKEHGNNMNKEVWIRCDKYLENASQIFEPGL